MLFYKLFQKNENLYKLSRSPFMRIIKNSKSKYEPNNKSVGSFHLQKFQILPKKTSSVLKKRKML